tara:strand:- start:435 stop:815 length:381 start_codon:yes stop_codon:yes gene_type:complete
MSKTYSHSEVMDLIHKCKESEREIWREKLEEKNERIEELEKSMDKLVDVLHRTDPTLTKQAKKAKRNAEVRAIMKKKRLVDPKKMNRKMRAEWMRKKKEKEEEEEDEIQPHIREIMVGLGDTWGCS